MKTSAVAAVALVCLAAAGATQVIPDFLEPGSCPSVDEKALWASQKPNLEKFSGKWFEYARTSNPYQLIEQCTHTNLTYNGNGFTHLTMGLDASDARKSRDGVTMAFTTGGNANNPHLSIMMDDAITAAPFVILDTDYSNYACIYSCMDWNNNYLTDFGFIWSRVPEMGLAHYQHCKNVFAKYAVDTNRFKQVEHGAKCDYADETQASAKQIIPDFLEPGSCPSVDEKALWEAQKPNHEKFSGKWFEYARTSNPFQLVEQCTHSNLNYNGNGFTHLTMGLDASGELKSRDGVTVAFTTGGNSNNPHLSMMMDDPITAAPFVILHTDYNNFACIYSCMDWNNSYLSDFGFIWSRVPEMNPPHYDKCKKAFAKHAVDTNRFKRVEQGPKCDYDLIKSHFMPQINHDKFEL